MRAANMQALTDDIQDEWPGTTVWGKGDLAHQSSPSDHNEDDTAGSKPEQTDADNNPEHRAIDVPTLGPMTMGTLRTIRERLVNRPANRARLKYVILEQTIWRRNGGWVPEYYNGEYHDHLHVSGYAPNDEDASSWDIRPDAPTPPIEEDDDMAKAALFHKEVTTGTSTVVTYGLQTDSKFVIAIEYAVAQRWAELHGDSREISVTAFDDLAEQFGAVLP